MPKKLSELIDSLPRVRQKTVESRAQELSTLRDLRRSARRTQVKLAEALGVGQDAISRIERRNDMLLSTLRDYVESLGGRLELVVKFPDRASVLIMPMNFKSRENRRPNPLGRVTKSKIPKVNRR